MKSSLYYILWNWVGSLNLHLCTWFPKGPINENHYLWLVSHNDWFRWRPFNSLSLSIFQVYGCSPLVYVWNVVCLAILPSLMLPILPGSNCQKESTHKLYITLILHKHSSCLWMLFILPNKCFYYRLPNA
jgi:hypothetical protein